MKTEVTLILIFTFINLSFCEEEGCYYLNPTKKSDCTSRSLSAEEKEVGADACCYETYKDANNNEQKVCIFVKKKEVTKDNVKELENANVKDVSVDCNSKWLNFSMLLIGLFALLF